MSTYLRSQAKEQFKNGAQPDEQVFATLFESLVFKHDDLRALFISYATQQEAEQGLDNEKTMTALRVKNVIDQLKAGVATDGDNLFKIVARVVAMEKILLGEGNDNAVIDKWQEVKKFLENIPEGTQTLVEILNKKSDTLVGDTKYSLQNTDHAGWLICNGQAVSRTKYAALFALIGTAFGAGDGSETFNLPDPRGRVLVAQGAGDSLTNRTLGEKNGEEKHTLSVDEMPAHNHNVNDPGHVHYKNVLYKENYAFGNFSNGGFNVTDRIRSEVTTKNYTEITIVKNGGDKAHNNMQPYLVCGNLFVYSGVLS